MSSFSNIFLREKKGGTHRVILKLKSLNNNVKSLHFKMETLKSAINLLGRNHWMASIDLKDAYYSIPVHQIDRQYLRFVWQDKKYQFNYLPNGPATAPRVFAKNDKTNIFESEENRIFKCSIDSESCRHILLLA